jgi:hypothetical protein
VVDDLQLDAFAQEKLQQNIEALQGERAAVSDLL